MRGEPLVLALAGMHVEIEAPGELGSVPDLPRAYRWMPHIRILDAPERHLEQLFRGGQHARFHAGIRKIRPNCLRIEVERRPPVLFHPMRAARSVNLRESRLTRLRKLQDHRVLLLRTALARMIQIVEERLHVRRRLHHLVRCRQIGPVREAQNRRNLLPDPQQLQQQRLIRRIRPRVVREKHIAPQLRRLRERQHRQVIRIICGQRDLAVLARLMRIQKIRR